MIFLNNTAYNKIIIYQEDTVYFKIGKEEKMKANNCINARQSWVKLLSKLKPTTRASKTKLGKKFANIKIDDVTRYPKYLITDIKLLRGDL